MKHKSMYLDWYTKIPELKYDLRSSGINYFNIDLNLKNFDLSINYDDGNPAARKIIGSRYKVKPKNVFISSEGASGQNTRIIRLISEINPSKNEVIVEYPTYEPLLRAAQEYFPVVKRIKRFVKNGYKIDVSNLKKIVSDKTSLLIITNPHAPTGVISNKNELKEIMELACKYKFFVLCDEIYAEFDRKAVSSIYSINNDYGITITGFSKAYGLGGLKLGVAIANDSLIKECYIDSLNTVGNHPNIVQYIAYELFTNYKKELEKHLKKWEALKKETQDFLDENSFNYLPSKVGITYWIETNIDDTYNWVNKKTILKHSLVVVPGAFFFYENNYKIVKSNMIRLGIGSINPKKSDLKNALKTFKKSLKS
ncbi:MAG: pyridoxal phosphate-dependent aminotransferase [Candidatus Thermoplasmatota archaeon]|nr:pyridoxal phosphate-dependent aminotransferase [Candidatus Thermoplasmatota archaeon]